MLIMAQSENKIVFSTPRRLLNETCVIHCYQPSQQIYIMYMYILYGYGCYMISTLFSVSNLLCSKTMDAQTQWTKGHPTESERAWT